RGAFPLERLNPREVQLFLAGQALSHIYTPKLTTFHEKSGLKSRGSFAKPTGGHDDLATGVVQVGR
ncbi:hypothetical protein, partial [Mycobacterium bourgelatii]|uniref:hypothetical protein n=1 Tax=Mycobacterium bourgelatii TaxID=1273442 RepID=UPI0021F3891F